MVYSVILQADETRPIERKMHPHQEIRIKNINGQPPSTCDAMSNGRPSRGFSDPSLAVVQQQPVVPSTATCRLKSPELFHSQHYHARRQRDRQQTNSRSNSAADLSLQSGTLNSPSSNASSLNNVCKVSFYFQIFKCLKRNCSFKKGEITEKGSV